jgi:hypothetical protein
MAGMATHVARATAPRSVLRDDKNLQIGHIRILSHFACGRGPIGGRVMRVTRHDAPTAFTRLPWGCRALPPAARGRERHVPPAAACLAVMLPRTFSQAIPSLDSGHRPADLGPEILVMP